jgi:rRNA maturation RNase YbeY
MKIKINNRQSLHRASAKRIANLTVWLMTRSRKLDPQTAWGEITVILTDDQQIAEIKERVFQRSEVTDVIALRYDPLPGVEERTTAELFVNIERATQCRQRNTWDTSKELALYLAHGCDHLAGSTDDTLEEQTCMRRRELRWLREADKLGLTGDLVG